MYAMRGTVEKPLTRLHEREHPFRLLLPGWENASVERREKSGWLPVAGRGGEFVARAGVYRLSK